MIRRPHVLRLLGVAIVLAASAGPAMARYEGNLNLFAGYKELKSGEWAPLEQQQQLGLMLAFGEERAVIHFALDVFLAEEDVTGVTTPDALVSTDSTEAAIGVRKVWKLGATRPHLGAGANFVSVSEERNDVGGTVTNKDRGYGVWVDAGVTWRLATHLNLGLEARFSSERVILGTETAPRDVTAGGVHFGLLIGYGW